MDPLSETELWTYLLIFIVSMCAGFLTSFLVEHWND